MDAVSLPRPAWMTEDLVLLEEQAQRFIAAEYVPHLDRWAEEGMYDREVWTKAGAAGVDKRPALFHNILVGGIGIVFMSLTNLRPYVIQPVDRRRLPFRADRPRHTA